MAATIAAAIASISSVEKPSEEKEVLLRSNNACFAALSIVPNSIMFKFLSFVLGMAVPVHELYHKEKERGNRIERL